MQIDRFISALNIINRSGINYDVIHMVNSASIVQGLACSGPEFAKFFEQKKFWVRSGLMLLEAEPVAPELLSLKTLLKPVLILTSGLFYWGFALKCSPNVSVVIKRASLCKFRQFFVSKLRLP